VSSYWELISRTLFLLHPLVSAVLEGIFYHQGSPIHNSTCHVRTGLLLNLPCLPGNISPTVDCELCLSIHIGGSSIVVCFLFQPGSIFRWRVGQAVNICTYLTLLSFLVQYSFIVSGHSKNKTMVSVGIRELQ
jgi:hypothetical protein